METQFLQSLLSRLLATSEKSGNKNDQTVLITSIIQISEHHIYLVLTELEKILSKKCGDFQRIRASDNPHDQLIFAEELLLLMEVIYLSLVTYCSTTNTIGLISQENSSNIGQDRETHQRLNKHTCNILMSTIGGVIFFQSQFLEPEIAARFNISCGKILSILSEINQEGANIHLNQILKQCLEPQAEARGSFYLLKSIQYLRLRTDGMMLLCSHIAEVIDAPTNSGKWKKNAMLDITTPLRLCIFQWLDTDSSAMRMIYTSAIDCPDHPSVLSLLHKLEPWVSGAKKRSAVWPLVMILLSLMPKAFHIALEQLRSASPVQPSKMTLEAKLLKRNLETLKPSTMQNILQKDSALFTELSLLALVSMMKVAAVLKRYLTFGTIGNVEVQSSPLVQPINSILLPRNQRSQSFSVSHSQRNPSVSINQNMETSFQNLWSFISPSLEKLVTMVFQGTYPTMLYYNAIATSPTTVFTPPSSMEHAHSSTANTVQEFTPESLFDLFMWSLFYIDQVKFFQLMVKIHCAELGSSNSLGSTFVRVQSICALSKILLSDYVDRIGKTPTWRLTLASEVRSAVLSNIFYFRNKYLEDSSSTDPERNFLLTINAYQTMTWEESRDSHPSFQSIPIENETIMELLKLITTNPWFVFVRKSIDEQSDNSILPTMFTVHLTVLLRDIISLICLAPSSNSTLSPSLSGQYDQISKLAEAAFATVVQAKYISLWTPKDPFQGVLNINAILLKYMSYELMHCGSDMKVKTMRLLKSMYHLLGNINEYIGEEDLLRDLSSSTEVIYHLIHVAISSAEAAILIHLCNSDTEIISLSASCLSLLCTYHEYISCLDCPVQSEKLLDSPSLYIKPTGNIWPIYREMSLNVGNILSVKLQQKSTRIYLSNMPCRTQGMNWALYSVMNRWISFNKYIYTTTPYTSNLAPLSHNTAFDEWSNYTGFLCALGDGLSTLQSPCTFDYLVPLMMMATILPPTSPKLSLSNSESLNPPNVPKPLFKSSNAEFEEAKFHLSTTMLIRSLLHLMLIQHPEKRVSLDVFMATGMFLTPSLIFTLFQELCVIQDLILDVLTRKIDFSASNLSSLSHSSRQVMVDFDTFISEMTLVQIYGFVQAMLTMLQLVFDREWYKASNYLYDTNTKLSKDKDNGSVVEKVVYRSALIVVRLLKQLQGYDSQVSESSSNSTSKNLQSLPPHVPSLHHQSSYAMDLTNLRVSSSEKFRLKKKTSDVIETFLRNKSGIPTTTIFHMKLLNILMDWTFDCTSHIEMLTGSGLLENKSSMTNTKKYARSAPPTSKLSGLRMRSSENDRVIPSEPAPQTSNTYSQEEYSLYRSTETAFARAVCYLLQGVELNSECLDDEITAMSPPNAQANSFKVSKGSNDIEKKSKLFNKYFHVLQYLLLSSLHNIDQASRDKNELLSTTVQALCNLLASNTGIGLKHMIEAASTHENQLIRGCYLRVFSDVISKSADISFAVDVKLPSYDDLLAELKSLLLSPDRELARLICSTARGKEAEEVGKHLLLIMDQYHSSESLKLLDWTIEYEVNNTARIGTLFRSETMSTKLIGSFFSSRGRSYLLKVLADPINQYLLSSPNLEVDPNKGVDLSQLETNTSNLKAQTTIFLNSILQSVSDCPKELKHILEVLRLSTARKFSNMEGCDRIAVAGYVFLRFFCPAIAMPDKYQLAPLPLNRQQSRGLLLIAKILQNLANGTHFTEECMEPFNSWIDSYAGAISFFSYEISTDHSYGNSNDANSSDDSMSDSDGDDAEDNPDNADGKSDVDSDDEDADDSVVFRRVGNHSSTSNANSGSNHLTTKEITAMTGIHKFLYTNQERLERILNHPTVDSDTIERPQSIDYPILREKLMVLLHKLGEPTEEVPAVAQADSSSQAKIDQNLSEADRFLRDVEKKRSKASIEFVREMKIFYQAAPPVTSPPSAVTNTNAIRDALGVSGQTSSNNQNHSFFFFICRRVTSETDALILIYIIVSEIMSVVRLGGSFDLIIDSSSFNTDAELPMWGYSKFWGKLKALLGSICSNSLKKIYVLYPSIVVVMSARKVLKKWGVKTRSVVEKVEVCTPSSLSQKYPHLSDKIPISTINIETGSSKKWQALFHDREVTLLICGALLIVQTSDKFGGLEYKRSDILSLLLIDNISAGNVDPRSGKRFGVQAEAFKRKFTRNSNRTGEEFDQHVIITYTASQSTRSLKLQCNHNGNFLSTLTSALTQVRQQRALEDASKSSGTRLTNRDAIPGMMLHVAFLNLFSESPSTRKTAFLLLCKLKETYHLPLTLPSEHSDITALFVPSNLSGISVTLSGEIALSHPEFGKEFLFESFQSLRRNCTSTQQKVAIIMYLSPWLPLLEQFYQQCSENKEPKTLSNDINESDQSTIVNIDTSNLRKKSLDMTPLKTPVRRTSTNSASFLSTLVTPSQTPISMNLFPESPEANKVTVSLFGGRVFQDTLDELIKEIEEMFEIAIIIGSEDPGIATLLASKLWEVIAPMPNLATLAMKHIVKGLKGEARSRCTMNKSSKGRDIRGAKTSSKSTATKQGFSYLGQSTTPFQIDSSKSDGSKGTSQPTDNATDCSYCLTLCEISTLLGLQSPNIVSDLIISEILTLLDMITDKKIVKSPTGSTSQNQSDMDRGESKSQLVNDTTSVNDEDDPLPVPREVLDGVTAFFAVSPVPHDRKTVRSSSKKVIDTTSQSEADAQREFERRQKRHPSKVQSAKISQENLMEIVFDESEIWVEIVALLRPLVYQIFQISTLLIHSTPKIVHLVFTIISYGYVPVLPHVHTLLSTMVYALTLYSRILFSSTRDLEQDVALDSQEAVSFDPIVQVDRPDTTTQLIVKLLNDILTDLNNDTFHLIFNKAPILTPNHQEKIINTLSSIFVENNNHQNGSFQLQSIWKKCLWDLSVSSVTRSVTSSNYTIFFQLLGNLMDMKNIQENPQFLKVLYQCLMKVIESYCIHVSSHIRTQDVYEKYVDTNGSKFIFSCLTKLVSFLEEDKLLELFWINTMIVLYFPLHLLTGPIALMHSIVRCILESCSQTGVMKHLEEMLLDFRKKSKTLNTIFRKLEGDRLIGISFQSSFSIALSSILMRGLQSVEHSTKDLTIEILKLMSENYQIHLSQPLADENQSYKSGNRGISGYSILLCVVSGNTSSVSPSQPLTPTPWISQINPEVVSTSTQLLSSHEVEDNKNSSEQSKTLQPNVISIHPDDPLYRSGRHRADSTTSVSDQALPNTQVLFFGDQNFPNNRSAVLFVTLLLSYFKHTSVESEQIFILSLLLQTIRELPSVLYIVYDVLFTQLTGHFNNCLDREGAITNAIFDLLNECLKRNGNREVFQVVPSRSLSSFNKPLSSTDLTQSDLSNAPPPSKKRNLSITYDYLADMEFSGLLIGPHQYALGKHTNDIEKCTCLNDILNNNLRVSENTESYLTPEFSLSSSLSSLIGDDDIYKMSKISQANAENLCSTCLSRYEANHTVNISLFSCCLTFFPLLAINCYLDFFAQSHSRITRK